MAPVMNTAPPDLLALNRNGNNSLYGKSSVRHSGANIEPNIVSLFHSSPGVIGTQRSTLLTLGSQISSLAPKVLQADNPDTADDDPNTSQLHHHHNLQLLQSLHIQEIQPIQPQEDLFETDDLISTKKLNSFWNTEETQALINKYVSIMQVTDPCCFVGVGPYKFISITEAKKESDGNSKVLVYKKTTMECWTMEVRSKANLTELSATLYEELKILRTLRLKKNIIIFFVNLIASHQTHGHVILIWENMEYGMVI
ncbi:hypothetical protein HELRODRAFT_181321 [Helobdella robusta]|uniref:Uncharacterized protein n=1 Tax=Helobdella robusta TaxID=6412 RepID=T1FGW2_HELRO|nr:hypothetical protein HELRODRAFT_181321 [Helobdella robusta]ESN92448.1 hypothetical protein HELRODRAFT_181321 [Helobdella robusta]